MTDQLPSKDVPLPTLMAWLRDRHVQETAAGNEWSYEGLIHAHIEHLQRELGLAVWAAGAKPKADPGPMGTCCYGGRKLRSDCASCAGWRADQPPGDGQS